MPTEEWIRRMAAIAEIAKPHQARADAIEALSFKLPAPNPIKAALDEFIEAASRTTLNSYEQRNFIAEVTDDINARIDALSHLDVVITMRENIMTAIRMQTNDDIARWLSASISSSPKIIRDGDGNVLFDPSATPATSSQEVQR